MIFKIYLIFSAFWGKIESEIQLESVKMKETKHNYFIKLYINLLIVIIIIIIIIIVIYINSNTNNGIITFL